MARPSLEADLGRPAERLAELAVVGVVVADVDRLPILRERDDPVATGAREANDQRRPSLEQLTCPSAPTLNTSPSAASDGRREAERAHDVVHVGEVAPLAAVAEDEDLLVGERLADPDAEERLPRVAHTHPRAVRVRQPQHRDRQPVDSSVEKVVPLARRLVDPVDVDRLDRMLLVDRQVARSTVDLARLGEDDPELGVVEPARLEERQLRCGS